MKSYERILIIVDIYGEFTKLMSLYKKLEVTGNFSVTTLTADTKLFKF